MAALTVTAACTACGACLLTCPTHALIPDAGRLRVRDDRCTRCGECVEICPADAIRLADDTAGHDGDTDPEETR
ncbi:ferredoxin-type protein NapF [Micromonospora pattaloongensis]|uniref:Ferredoxin-type protein NapF n=1 Tax=Micromonospora pattaloongensis TaxID=405436 RepID=A0A1H3NTL1_9ACTN|nr:4Fe-4S binding protein [Micromonospora pattaloongensis]SDY92266.1 ferredoxin-type protein NapF [Micromonospora pattaloongensis]